MAPDGDMPQGGSSSSSDFVRKLYKMLEDPSYSSVVRWGNDGDSFVVLENEKFTKTILPKHFKHSNFASFVRQLNKYDFHKVRHNDESGQSPYGPQTWEFKHPEFRADRKDNLDSIRRKAPAPRKAASAEDPFPASQQLALLNDTLFATQQQVQQLQEQFMALSETNKLLVAEVTTLQKMVGVQKQSQQEMLNYLSHADDWRTGRHSNPGSAGGMSHVSLHTDDEPTSLRRARDLLQSVTPNQVADRELERINSVYQATPGHLEALNLMLQPGAPALMPTPLPEDSIDMRHLVYPVGQEGGIDPFHADHIGKIPYSLPASQAPPNGMVTEAGPPSQAGSQQRNISMWGPRRPTILLVEDDKTCARIGSKFLQQLGCNVEIAVDGLQCVRTMNREGHKFDLIFMDIIMPNLDGVSATACIREVQPKIPIVAMTSNIRPEDVETYFQWGMTAVLAKPFTRDGMQRVLKERLPWLLKDPPTDMLSPNSGGHASLSNTSMSMPGLGGMAAAGSVKLDHTPIQSPSTTGSWHSPGQMPQPSPTVGTMDGYGMNNGGSGLTPKSAQRAPPHMGGMMAMNRLPDGMVDERPEKRARHYGPQGTYAQ